MCFPGLERTQGDLGGVTQTLRVQNRHDKAAATIEGSDTHTPRHLQCPFTELRETAPVYGSLEIIVEQVVCLIRPHTSI